MRTEKLRVSISGYRDKADKSILGISNPSCLRVIDFILLFFA